VILHENDSDYSLPEGVAYNWYRIEIDERF